ncbi:hypothetical protein QTP88_025828 [Uroleucon formosanum]
MFDDDTEILSTPVHTYIHDPRPHGNGMVVEQKRKKRDLAGLPSSNISVFISMYILLYTYRCVRVCVCVSGGHQRYENTRRNRINRSDCRDNNLLEILLELSTIRPSIQFLGRLIKNLNRISSVTN